MAAEKLPSIIVDGVTRPLGCLPKPRGLMLAVPMRESALIPRSQWYEFDNRDKCPFENLDQDGIGACFPPGTRVRMGDGTNRCIEDARLLEQVVTAEGGTGTIIRTMVRQAGPTILRLILWGHSHLRLTEDHPVLTRRGYIPAGQLTLEDWVALPKYMASGSSTIHVEDHLARRRYVSRGREVRHFNAPQGRAQTWVKRHVVPDFLEMTPGVGRLLGLYLAEGASSHSKIVWTFNVKEEETLVADTVALLKSEWGLEARIQRRPNNSINVVVDGADWARLLESVCMTGSASKRLAPVITGGPRDFQAAMLEGWLDGDGHKTRTQVEGVTISRDLALGMFDIANALGRRPMIRRYHSKTYGRVATRQPRWEVVYSLDGATNYRSEQDETHAWRKVRGLEQEEYSGPVFNLEVEDDNSYVAEGIGVHNCNPHAGVEGMMMARWMAGIEPHVDLSPWLPYADLTGGHDVGSSIAELLQYLTDKGTCRKDLTPYGKFDPNKIPAAARADASNYRIEIGARLTSFDAIVSAILRGWMVNLSLDGNQMGGVDSNGRIGKRAGTGNHALSAGYGLRNIGGEWLPDGRNHWENFGIDGKGWFRFGESNIRGQRYFDAYAVMAILDSPNGNNPPLAP